MTSRIFAIPNSETESDALLIDAKVKLGSFKAEKDDEALWDACKELIGLAGSFNHNITHIHKSAILDLLVNVGIDAIDPVLDDLVECPRQEQINITRDFITRLINKAREESK